MRFPSISIPIQLDEIDDRLLAQKKLCVLVLRTDLVHRHITGNKFYKLYYNLHQAKDQQKSKILTFGGAFSNHIFATANASKRFDLQSIGIIRGEEHLPLNPVLAHAKKSGMKLCYMDRARYRNKNTSNIMRELRNQYGDFYFIPEGGSNLEAVRGCAQIPRHFPLDIDFVCCPCGTGGTLAGLIAGSTPETKCIGFSALKGGSFLVQEVQKLLNQFQMGITRNNWSIHLNYHFGGYAKQRPELMQFIDLFYKEHHILLEPIYTGKMFYGVWDLVKQDFFPPHSKIVLVHTGGIYPLYGRGE